MDWRKSSYSGANGGDCVEVAADAKIRVRDTTDRDGVTLGVTVGAWLRFTSSFR